MHDGVHITNVREDLLASLASCYCQVFEKTDQAAILEMIRREVYSHYHYIVAIHRHEVVGFVCWCVEGADSSQLVELFHYGALPGYGDLGPRLLEYFEQEAHRRFQPNSPGCRRIYLKTHADRSVLRHRVAQAAYRRAGYIPGPILGDHFRPGCPELYMYKDFPQHVRTP